MSRLALFLLGKPDNIVAVSRRFERDRLFQRLDDRRKRGDASRLAIIGIDHVPRRPSGIGVSKDVLPGGEIGLARSMTTELRRLKQPFAPRILGALA